MKNLIMSLIFLLPIFVFGQNLNDLVNFDSLNKELINNQFINKLTKLREIKNATKLFKDTIPMCAAKFHTMYFERYGDESNVHSKDSFLFYDLFGQGVKIQFECATPLLRLTMAEFASESPDSLGVYNYNFKLIQENSKFYNFHKSQIITYNELIENILYDFTQSNINDLLLDFTNEKKYIGVSTGLYKTDNESLILSITYVLSKYVE